MAQNKAQSGKAGSGKAGSGKAGSGGAGKAALSAEPKPKKKKVGPMTFLRQVRQEGSKVTWTSRSETVAATIMVLIMTVVAAIFLLTVDQIVGWSVRLISGV